MGYRGLIIALTGTQIVEDRELFLASGADHVLMKPVDVNKLETILKGSSEFLFICILQFLSCLMA